MNHVAQLISDRNHIDNVFFFKQKTAYEMIDRKSTRLNSSHQIISYAVFCLKKKKHTYELQSPNQLICRPLSERSEQEPPDTVFPAKDKREKDAPRKQRIRRA